MAYTMVWTNYDFVEVGEIDQSKDRKFSFRLNQPNTAEFKVPLNTRMGRQIAAAPYGFGYVKVYEGGTLRMVAETTSMQVIGKKDEKSVAIVATETMYPRLQGIVIADLAPYVMAASFNTTGALQTLVHAFRPYTQVDWGSYVAGGANVESNFDAGTTLLDWISAFAFRNSGFDFWATPVEPDPSAGSGFGAGTLALLNFASIKGSTKANVSFEFGVGTAANCDEYSLTSQAGDNLATSATVIGPNPNPGLSNAVAANSGAQSRFGYRQRLIQSDVDDVVMRQGIADLHVAKRGNPRLLFSLTPSPYDGTGRVPRFWYDYDVGDIVEGTIKEEGDTLLNAQVRIYVVEVSLNDAGLETINLTLNSDTSA